MNKEQMARIGEWSKSPKSQALMAKEGEIGAGNPHLPEELRRARWIEEVYQCLCKSQGAPENPNEEKNLREWAASLASDDTNFFAEGWTPQDAHDEELSNA